ncbi:MFS transporter [Halocatena marina]|nr:MFS transporter [Halocatena marina]
MHSSIPDSPLSSVPRAVLAVVLSTFFLGFGGGVVFPILPNLGTVLGLSSFTVGLVLSANRIVRLVTNAPAGTVVDRLGTRGPFLVGVCLETAATFGYVIGIESPTPAGWFIGARVLWGLGSAFVLATAYTIAADVSNDDTRGTNMSVVRGATSLGFPAGMALGGVISELYGPVTAFESMAVLSVIACLISYREIPETHADSRSESVGLRDIYLGLPAIAAGGANFGLLFTYSGIVFATLVSYLDTTTAASVAVGPQGTSGVLIGVSVLTGSVFAVIGGRLSDVLARRLPFVVGCLGVTSIGVIVLSVANSFPLLVTAVVLLGVGQGGAGGPLLSLLGDLTPNSDMGRATGTYNTFGDLGASTGLLISLPVANAIGFDSLYRFAAVVPIIAAAVVIFGVANIEETAPVSDARA